MIYKVEKGSFRDPSGYLFWQDGVLYRQINNIYKDDYEHFISSGLYSRLVDEGLIIRHTEVDESFKEGNDVYKIIKPDIVDFISYPYEWCFSQLKNAAIAMMKIQKLALEYGMILKDSSAYNIQFIGYKPLLIDTLSFEKYVEGQPWIGYRQFCQHFLAPLVLMSYKDIRLNQLLKIYIDGIPLDLASALIPLKAKLNFNILMHIILHAGSQKKYSSKQVNVDTYKIKYNNLVALIESMESFVSSLKLKDIKTEWQDYYDKTNYSLHSFENKKQLVKELIERCGSETLWDIGANTGVFSRISGDMGIKTISFDIDPVAIERNYYDCHKNLEQNILPLVMDFTNPSPGIGWADEERGSLFQRNKPDTVLALAIIHHLAISNNVPFSMIAELLSRICNNLIIEYVPKSDSQVQKLLATRKDIFSDYTQDCFEKEFSKYFTIIELHQVEDSERIMYLMKKSI